MSILFQHGSCGMAMDQPRSSAIAALVGITIGVNLALAQSAVAQVTPDGTLSTTVTTTDNLNFVIDQGDRAGNHLFHSFDQFSLPTNGSAIFNNTTDIQTIFSRVTGNSLSDIDGLIQTNGSANLFLLNPNGIVFGPNAELNLGGSFLGSTADRFIFEDGVEFSATDQTVPPLLSIMDPIGLQYGSDPGHIIVQSRQGDTSAISGLTVPSGHALGLMGGRVKIDGGMLQTTGGNLEIGSVGPNSEVELSPIDNAYDQYEVTYDDTDSFDAIRLSNNALISSQEGGDIRVRGDRIHLSQDATIATTNMDRVGGDIDLNAQRRISLDTGAKLYTLTDGIANSGDITLDASRRIDLRGIGYDEFLENLLLLAFSGTADISVMPSHITTLTTGQGDGGAIAVSTSSLSMTDGMRLSSFTTATGSAQHILITASSNLTLTESTISSNADLLASGNGGDLDIITPTLIVTNASINSSASGSGIGGNVTIQAETIEVRDTRTSLPPIGLLAVTTIGTTTLGVGDAGDTIIDTNTLLVQDGATVAAATLGQVNPDSGAGGNIVVNATDWITLEGGALVEGLESGISTTSSSNSPAGNIDLSTRQLTVLDGATIQSDTYGTAPGGNISILATDRIEVTGFSQSAESDTRINSQISAATRLGELTIGLRIPFIGDLDIPATGDAGRLTITTPHLSVNNGGRITVSSDTPGAAGDLRIQADRIVLDQDGDITGTTAGGDGGNLVILASDTITLNRQSAITSSSTASATGESGDIQIRTGAVRLIDSRIEANNLASGGQGGSMDIRTQQPLRLNNSAITAVTASGDGGDLNFKIDDLLLLEGNSIISTTAGQEEQIGNGGNISIRTPLLIAPETENNDITANAFTGNGGNITIATQGLFGLAFRDRLTSDNDITASSEFGLNGTVKINSPEADPNSQVLELPDTLVDISQVVRPGCSLRQDQFVLTGRGGLPDNPMDLMDGDRPWSDTRDLSAFLNHELDHPVAIPAAQPFTPLQEATGMAIAPDGHLQLVASHGRNLSIPQGRCAAHDNFRDGVTPLR